MIKAISNLTFVVAFVSQGNHVRYVSHVIRLTTVCAFCFPGIVRINPISTHSGILKNEAKKGEEDSLGEFVSLIMCGMFPISH